ncbi:exosortase-associated EpsI family protein [Opitutaceae bacterium TAV4]|nr:exosortase-associated EpsI family protein [Opitutaceae bacterium TAV4]RRJ94509.1 exosortase-associated EpsI family protein [Opitutaceae bacterium TAV4]RRJ98571.1 exosortase-associated EpsI family protein [Opitutaceae bacterium TAV3]
MKKSLLIALVVMASILLFGVGLVIYGNSRIPEPKFHGKLKDLLPPPPSGWTMTEKPIADTPEMQKAVGELLNYDDGIFVDYSDGVNRLSVYIAYWTPGKMSHRLVAGHTPDVCWVGNGWKKEESETISGLSANNKILPPAEGRVFSAQGHNEYVWFWHVVGVDVKSYATGHVPPWYAVLIDMFERGVNQREEQFFIRISAGHPLGKSEFKPILDAILTRLPLPGNKSDL